ncbi:iron chelate uptake ABC transporter family permease subunit, partial [Aeromonas veronii]
MNDLAALQQTLARQRQRERRRGHWLLLLTLVLCITLVLDIATGPSLLPLGEVVDALLAPAQADPMTRTIVHDMRLPIALMALVVGAALGLGGVQMQTLLDNPLASPYTLGLAAAAGLGAALALYTGGLGLPPLVAIPAGAFI